MTDRKSVFLDPTGQRRRLWRWTTIVTGVLLTIAATSFLATLLINHPSSPTLPLAMAFLLKDQRTVAEAAGRGKWLLTACQSLPGVTRLVISRLKRPCSGARIPCSLLSATRRAEVASSR